MSNEERMVELLSLLLDEQKNMRIEMRTELQGVNLRLDKLETQMQGVNTRLDRVEAQIEKVEARLGALEFAVLHETRELRGRVERIESTLSKMGYNPAA